MHDTEFELIENIIEQHMTAAKEMTINAIAAISEAGKP